MLSDNFAKAIIVFLRYPVAGLVKKRLARSIGNENAAIIYRKMADKVIATIREAENTDILFFLDGNRYITESREWLGKHENIRVQCEGDLGQRMAHAFNVAFENGYKQVLLIGTDIPSITTHIIQKAFLELGDRDSVLGGTLDGGYYLVGLKSSADYLFANMVWSTNAVFSETMLRLKNRGMSCGLLPLLRDIDTVDDLEKEGMGHYNLTKEFANEKNI